MNEIIGLALFLKANTIPALAFLYVFHSSSAENKAMSKADYPFKRRMGALLLTTILFLTGCDTTDSLDSTEELAVDTQYIDLEDLLEVTEDSIYASKGGTTVKTWNKSIAKDKSWSLWGQYSAIDESSLYEVVLSIQYGQVVGAVIAEDALGSWRQIGKAKRVKGVSTFKYKKGDFPQGTYKWRFYVRAEQNSNVTVTWTKNTPSQTINLLWPMKGGFKPSRVTSPFADDWVNSCGGKIKKHAAIDYGKTDVGDIVKAAHTGRVREVLLDGKWKHGVVIEDDSKTFTTVYWHIDPSSNIREGAKVKRGEQIGTIADIRNSSGHLIDHLHFGYRRGAYEQKLSIAGSLPQTNCSGYPAFPERFEDPATFKYDSW